MRRKVANGIRALAWGAAAWGAVAAAEVDLNDMDTLVMQDMDSTIKHLEPLIGAKDVAAATQAATFLQEGLKWTEDYFAGKAGADDAVRFAREGGQRAAEVLKSLESNDLAAAAAAARGVAKSCRTCHDVYRP